MSGTQKMLLLRKKDKYIVRPLMDHCEMIRSQVVLTILDACRWSVLKGSNDEENNIPEQTMLEVEPTTTWKIVCEKCLELVVGEGWICEHAIFEDNVDQWFDSIDLFPRILLVNANYINVFNLFLPHF